MCANGLFVIGAALAVLDDIRHLTSILPFHYTEHNFYRAAKYGIGAEIIWPHKDQVQLQDTPLLTVARELLPRAREALKQTAVDETEIRRLLGIIEGRIETNMSGARWQRHVTESFFRSRSPDEAFRMRDSFGIRRDQTCCHLKKRNGASPYCEIRFGWSWLLKRP